MRRSALAGAIVGVCCLTSCATVAATSSGPPSPTQPPQFTTAPSPTGPDLSEVEFADALDRDTTQTRTELSTLNGGEVTWTVGPDGHPWMRFPRFRQQPKAPSAVLAIWPSNHHSSLSPGDTSFSFGASFRLDAESSGSTSDNGDNLLQRGLFGNTGQYKIQVDHNVPSCRIRGQDGAVLVEAQTAVDPELWYRVQCTKDGNRVTLTMSTYEDGDPVRIGTYYATGQIGAVTLPEQGAPPLTVGGKMSAAGEIVASSTDQFNGWIGNIFVRIER